MNINDLLFRRKFSLSLYKNLKLKLAQMDFCRDVAENPRGNKYPLMFSSGEYSESVSGGEYVFDGGVLARYVSPLYPHAVNEVTVNELCGECGFVFEHGGDRVTVTLKNDEKMSMCFECGKQKENVEVDGDFSSGTKFSVLVRGGCFDVYVNRKNFPEYVCTFKTEKFEASCAESFFMTTSVGIVFSGHVVCAGAEIFNDSGVAQADIRPVRYENGEVIYENGRMFFTASIRYQEGGCQGVFSWIPGTAEFELTGVLFFDTGDGKWSADVATCLVFDRHTQKWLLWVCSFSHGHILGHACFDGEPRYGRNVIDITLVSPLPDGADDTAFGGKRGDEDPALIYDEKRSKWLLAVCRVASDGHYRYYFYESDSPFEGFVCVGSGQPGAETGGSFVRLDGELYFICGNSMDETSCYRAYKYGQFDKFEKLKCDRYDGGFRGWGSVFTVKQGTRERIYWLTFDRQLGSSFNWSYGNLYCFEA